MLRGLTIREELLIENRALTDELREVHERHGREQTATYTDACRIASEHRQQVRELERENERLRERLAILS